MNTLVKQYLQILHNSCEEIHLDYFPQVEASELLYKVITLEDIYLPLTLGNAPAAPYTNDIDELIKRIDKKLAELEALEKGEIITEDDSTVNASDVGLRLLLSGYPGGGKSTFCKRLILAIINNDTAFFEKYLTENGLVFNQQSTPVLVDCKNIADMALTSIQSNSFQDIVYRLCELGLGNQFSALSKSDFAMLFLNMAESGMTLIVDGWDEILDKDREKLFRQKLDDFICEYPQVDLVVTIRVSYPDPEFTQPYSKHYYIQQLSPDETREFCKKWCEVILGGGTQRQANSSEIANQILSSNNLQIRSMGANPLDLSLLLTVSKNDGRLPDNKAELFREVIDLYIFWSTHKNTGALSSKAIRVFLSYIACCLTKQKKLTCTHNELIAIIKQCTIDLEWSFSEDVTAIDVNEIIKELSHTGILTNTIAGSQYSFSETRKGTHRQNQEYLTAYAILVGYADEDYNNQAPVDIFEGKYESRQWREVILFMILMHNGRVRQEIINRLICKAQNTEEDTYHYTNLLFEAIVNGADIRLTDKHKIYDIVFDEHITDLQVSNIYLLMQNETNKTAHDFAKYISQEFASSVGRCDRKTKYRYAKAIVEATRAHKDGISPFSRAQALMSPENTSQDIVTGLSIVFILAWCKYANVNNAFKQYYSQYKMPRALICSISRLLAINVCKTELLECVKEAILADFVSYADFFDISNLCEYYDEICSKEKTSDAEIVLSMAPIFSPSFLKCETAPQNVKDRYLQQYREQNTKEMYDDIVFTFSICVALDCWNNESLNEEWSALDKLYSNAKIGKDTMGKIRFEQLKKSRNLLNGINWLKTQEFPSELFPHSTIELPPSAPSLWTLLEQTVHHFTYIKGDEKLLIYYSPDQLTEDAKGFLDNAIMESISSKNNLAYLLRRHEITRIEHIAKGESCLLPPEALLSEGSSILEPFSLTNMALAISQTHANVKGNPEMGQVYLSSHLANNSLDNHSDSWDSVVAWWLELACKRHELEGLIVINWLFGLNIFIPALYSSEILKKLSSFAKEVPEGKIEGLHGFISALEHTVQQR